MTKIANKKEKMNIASSPGPLSAVECLRKRIIKHKTFKSREKTWGPGRMAGVAQMR